MIIRVAEGFAGVGGFRLGFEEANKKTKTQNKFQFVWANDNDKYAAQVYRKRFGTAEFTEANIEDISTDDIPDFDIFVGGFPCQPHSLAGQRKGFGEKRGEVFYEIIRIIKAKRPKLLLLENVKGLLSNEEGKAYGTIMEELGYSGYWCEWQNLNSEYHGVPQNRERIFIIGHLREGCTERVFPLNPSGSKFVQFSEENERQEIAWAIRSRDYKDGTNFLCCRKKQEPQVFQEHSFSGENGRGRGLRVFDGYSPTLSGQMGTGGNNVPMVFHLAGARENPVLTSSDEAFCLAANPMSDRTQVLSDIDGFRKFTEKECERLQGIPDDWTKLGVTTKGKEVKISKTQRYKMCGNAVTTNVIAILGLEILKVFNFKK